jgi:hypothetical protein
MANRKSIIIRVAVDSAQRAHNCQHNPSHRLQQGDKRLKIRKQRTWEHFCVQCALEIIAHGRSRLDALARDLTRP